MIIKECITCKQKYKARLKNQKFCSGKCKNNNWYENNSKDKKKYQLEYLKKKNYAPEKSKEQRQIRSIKRRTRELFPLIGHFCEFCGDKATEHHHNTNPIEVEKFNYVCHKCHLIKNKLFKGGNK